MNYPLLAKIFGSLLLLLALSMLACTFFAWRQESIGEINHGAVALSITTAVTALSGLLLLVFGRGCKLEILRKEAVVVVGFGWILSAVFGAIPYMLASPGLTVDAAFFESMSGFTTTGSTVIAKLDEWPKAILMWRATTQWLGGLGILVLFVALLSYLGVGSKSLFRFESSLRLGEASQTQIRRTARILLLVYMGLTVIAIVGLMASGCSQMKIEDFAGTEPEFVLEDYFAGHTRAWGMFEDRFGRKAVGRFHTREILCVLHIDGQDV